MEGELGDRAFKLLPLMIRDQAKVVGIGLRTRLFAGRLNAIGTEPVALLPIPFLSDALRDGIRQCGSFGKPRYVGVSANE